LDAVATLQQALPWPAAARPTRRQNVHVTLHFIGQVPRSRLPELVDAFAVAPPTIRLTFDRLALWSRGLVVLTASRPPGALLELHAALGDRLRDADLPVEPRPYCPHITLARTADASVLSSEQARAQLGVTWRSEGYALVESAGGSYNVLARY
jgi:2'-5' RNA ligase